jgi:lipopolysaccharide assembly outer membrane protein LptD (OstA)
MSPRRALFVVPLLAFFLFASSTRFSFSKEEPKPQPKQQAPSQQEPKREPPASPQQKSPGLESPITFLAQNWEKKENRIFASGNVEVHYKDSKLFADEVDINTETKDVFAKGNVVIQVPGQVVSADSVFYNLDSHQGKYEHVNGMIQPDIFYQAAEVEQKDQDTFELTKARLTSCTQPTPRWKFSCARGNFKKDDYVEMWNSVFSIKKIPVFYMPYFRYPLNRERSTGFLMPQVGYTGVKGFFYGQSFYWAMARNLDASFNLDYYSAKGVGGGLEYRYLFRDGTGGEAKVYYFLFKPSAREGDETGASIVRFNHNQPLPADFRFVANIDYQTSIDFLRQFDNNFKRASISNFKSEAYISRAWSYYNFSLRGSRFETFFRSVDNSIITYYQPQLTLNSFKIKLFSPLYFSFSSGLSSWKYGWKNEYDAGTEKYYTNASFSPTLSLPFSSIPWLTVNMSLGSNFVYYAQSYAPNSHTIINDPLFQSSYGVDIDWTGPVFYRIYQSVQGTTKVKHLIEPRVRYQYDSPVADPERTITPYGYFFRYHQLTYGLTNRILVKKDMTREIFTWGISQTYYLSPEDSPNRIYRWKGTIPRYSDVSSYVRFYPAQKYSLDISSGYNPYYKTFSYLRLGASLNSFSDPYFLSVSWFKSLSPWYKTVLFDRQQISVVGRMKIPRLQLEALGEFDFNIFERKMLYSGVSLVYHYQCFDFKVDMRTFYYRVPAETQFSVSIGLGNIGKTMDFWGGLE